MPPKGDRIGERARARPGRAKHDVVWLLYSIIIVILIIIMLIIIIINIILIIIIISSLRALRRARDGAAKGRGSWERIRWPDAKFEVTGAKCDLRNEQQR